MRNQKHFRQGDIGIARVTKKFDINMELKPIKAVNGRLILAYGEATGHHHSVSLLDYPETELYDVIGEAEKMLLKVAEPGVVIEHQEHAAIILEPGWYEIHRQVEYSPEDEYRYIAD